MTKRKRKQTGRAKIYEDGIRVYAKMIGTGGKLTDRDEVVAIFKLPLDVADYMRAKGLKGYRVFTKGEEDAKRVAEAEREASGK